MQIARLTAQASSSTPTSSARPRSCKPPSSIGATQMTKRRLPSASSTSLPTKSTAPWARLASSPSPPHIPHTRLTRPARPPVTTWSALGMTPTVCQLSSPTARITMALTTSPRSSFRSSSSTALMVNHFLFMETVLTSAIGYMLMTMLEHYFLSINKANQVKHTMLADTMNEPIYRWFRLSVLSLMSYIHKQMANIMQTSLRMLLTVLDMISDMRQILASYVITLAGNRERPSRPASVRLFSGISTTLGGGAPSTKAATLANASARMGEQLPALARYSSS